VVAAATADFPRRGKAEKDGAENEMTRIDTAIRLVQAIARPVDLIVPLARSSPYAPRLSEAHTVNKLIAA